jgi:hypothetical protein
MVSAFIKILIKDVLEGHDLPCNQQLFNSRNRDALRLSLGGTMLLAFFKFSCLMCQRNAVSALEQIQGGRR